MNNECGSLRQYFWLLGSLRWHACEISGTRPPRKCRTLPTNHIEQLSFRGYYGDVVPPFRSSPLESMEKPIFIVPASFEGFHLTERLLLESTQPESQRTLLIMTIRNHKIYLQFCDYIHIMGLWLGYKKSFHGTGWPWLSHNNIKCTRGEENPKRFTLPYNFKIHHSWNNIFIT